MAAVVALLAAVVLWGTARANRPASPLALAKVGDATTSSVAFRWAPPPTGPTPDRYLVLRGGRQVASLPGSVRRWIDTGLAPATAYRYQVVAVVDGRRSEPSATLLLRTGTPAVSAARLRGVWPVHVKVVGSGGGTLTVGRTMTNSWVFRPNCDNGPCSVVVSGVLGGSGYTLHHFTATLYRQGAVYTGSTRAHITHCGNEPLVVNVTNTLNLRITVTRAGVSGGSWSASSWAGTMRLSSPYTSAGVWYCPAQTVTATLRASR